ncbi:MAG: futalosine hydrolase [Bacillota bacterium]|nr:futalosine hydrolase [Bacillota bacterium]
MALKFENKIDAGSCKFGTNILIMTSVQAERDAILAGLAGHNSFNVQLAGVGPISAAIKTTKALATGQYQLVISAGIAGGFAERAEVGSLVVGSYMVAADLGVETLNGFNSLDMLGFGSTEIQGEAALIEGITGALRAGNVPVNIGPILTVATATGTAERAVELARRVPGATAEAMEGFGVALAAKEYGAKVMELRAISNLVGPRDRAAWRIEDALKALTAAMSVLPEVLL